MDYFFNSEGVEVLPGVMASLFAARG